MAKTIKLKVQLLEHVDLGPESDGEEIIIDDPSGDNTGQTGESGNQPGENEQGSSEIRVETEIRNKKTTKTIFGNDTTSLIFKINIPFENFESLKIRDVEFVRDKDYVAKSGSTIIDFTETGLNKLKKFVNGDYVVSFKFRDRTVTTNLTISLTETKNPFENFVERTKTNTEGRKTEVKNDAKQSTEKSEEGASASINAPNSGTFNYYDSLTTGFSVFSIGFLLLLTSLLIFKRLKKNNKTYINFKKKKLTALKSLTLLFLAISLGFVAVFFKETTFGVGFNEVPLHANDVQLTADILGTDRIAWTKATVVVLQKSFSGYRIYLHGGDTALKNFFDENLAINSIEEAGPLVNNSFGYTLENPEGREDLVTWYPINLEENRSLLADIDGPVEAGAEISIYFGVRSKNLDVGAYSLDLTYSAISKEPLKMQEMSSDVCSNLEPGATYEFEDERDGKVYTVARLADDECWMTSDLETELIVRDSEAGIRKINADESEEIVPITNENTDLNTKSAFIPNKSTMTDEDISWPDSCDSEEACQINQSFKHTNEDNETTFYYSWFTATLNSLSTQEEIMSGETRAKDSICPKGWSLPTSNNYTSLILNYGSDEDVYYSAPINISGKGIVKPINAGEIQGENDKDAYYYTSDLSLSEGYPEMYYFEIYTDKGDVRLSYSDTFYGTPLRCIANLSSANIIYNKNTTSNRIGNFPENSRATANENKEIEYTLPENIPTRSGYRFGGWALSEDGMPEYEPGEEIKIKNRSIVLYAVWLKETGKTMQEMTSSYCRNEIKANEFYLFTDSRDEKEYIVSKYPDGNCWMTENLDLDLSSDITLTSEDTDIEENYTPSIATPTEEGEWAYGEKCLEGDLQKCEQYFFDSGKKSDGNFYNIFTATAKTASLDFEKGELASPKNSICPKGWKLPDTEQYINLLGNQGFEYGDEDDITPDMTFPKPYDTSKGFYIGTEYVRESSRLNIGFYENGVVDMQGASMKMNAYQTAPDAVMIVAQYYGDMGHYMYAKASDMVGGSGLLLEGLPVRCYSAFDTLEIVYDKNTDDPVSNFPEENTQKSLSEGRDVEISNLTPTRDGYVFAGWATSPNGSAEYSPGSILTAMSPEITLYAVWMDKIESAEYLQDLTFDVCESLIVGKQYGLKDVRDQKVYTISRLADGNCWMTSDLTLALNPETPLTNETTDLNSKSSWTPKTLTETHYNEDWYCYGQSCDETSHSLIYNGNYYYSYLTATANSVPTSTEDQNTFAPDSICPKGWYLPTKNSLQSLVSAYNSSHSSIKNAPTNFKDRGNIASEYISSYTTYYWTGSSNDQYSARALEFYSDDDKYPEVNGASKYYGAGIRCILKSPASFTLSFHTNTSAENMSNSLAGTGDRGSATLTIPETVPKSSGKIFSGWSRFDYSCGGHLLAPGDQITIEENTVLWACFEDTFTSTLTFTDYNGDTLSTPDSISSEPRTKDDYYKSITFTIPLEEPSRQGYIFLGWSESSNSNQANYHPGGTYTVNAEGNSEHYLYAVWRGIPKVYFYSDTSDPVSNMPETMSIETNPSSTIVTFTIPATIPTRDGYTFNGWRPSNYCSGYTVLDSNAEYSCDISTIYDVHLYAIWQVNLYTLELLFDLNSSDASGEFPSLPGIATDASQNVTFTLSDAVPSRPGYNFLGWSRDSDATYASYGPGNSITLRAEFDGQFIALYAIWQEVPKTAKAILDSNGNLDFVYDSKSYQVGEDYENSLGNSGAITRICDVGQMSNEYSECHGNRSNSNTNITTVSFDNSFKDYLPVFTKYWFFNDTLLSKIYNLNNLNTTNTRDMNSMFYGTSSLTSLTLPAGFGQNATNMSLMFYETSSLTTLELPVGFGQNATGMGAMFSGASSLTSLTLPAGFGQNATNMDSMFSHASSLTSLTLPAGFGSNATGISYTFAFTSSLTSLSLPAGFGSNATNMSGMFAYASSLTSLELPAGFGSSATNMTSMFSGASSLTSLTLPSGFGVKVTNTKEMFHNASSLTSLTLPADFGSSVTNVEHMFTDSSSLEHIYVEPGTDWNTKEIAVTDSTFMFSGASKLPGYNGSRLNNATYAHIGDKDGVWGYFEPWPEGAYSEQASPLGVIATNRKESADTATVIVTIVCSALVLTGAATIFIIEKRRKED